MVAGLERPLQARAGLKSQGAHSAYPAGGNCLPTQVARHIPLVFGVALGSAACRGEECRESTAAGDWRRLGSSGRRLMDL